MQKQDRKKGSQVEPSQTAEELSQVAEVAVEETPEVETSTEVAVSGGVVEDNIDDDIAENDEYRYIEKVEVINPRQKAVMREDFHWLGELKVDTIDGQRAIRDESGAFIISDVEISESAFVSRWLDQFALGYVGETNYFDATAWGKFTHGHQNGVIIVSDEGKPLFVIPPLSRAQFTPMEQAILDLAHKSYTDASSAEKHGDTNRAQEIINSTTEIIKEYVSDDSISITDLVPDWFYEKYDVVPYIKRSMLFCRDVYGLNPSIAADWNMAESVFTAIHRRQPVSDIQRNFMAILTSNTFVMPEYDVIEDLGNPQQRVQSNSTDSDPFEN